MRVHIGSDHAGFELKNHLVASLTGDGFDVVDHGPEAYDAEDDYPTYCLPTAEAVVGDPGSLGVVIGGSGNGEQMAANRVTGIRAALAYSSDTARLAREHNDAQRDRRRRPDAQRGRGPRARPALPGHAVQQRSPARPTAGADVGLRSRAVATRWRGKWWAGRAERLRTRRADRLRTRRAPAVDAGPEDARPAAPPALPGGVIVGGCRLADAHRRGPADRRAPTSAAASSSGPGRLASRERMARSSVTRPETPSRPKSRGHRSRPSPPRPSPPRPSPLRPSPLRPSPLRPSPGRCWSPPRTDSPRGCSPLACSGDRGCSPGGGPGWGTPDMAPSLSSHPDRGGPDDGDSVRGGGHGGRRRRHRSCPPGHAPRQACGLLPGTRPAANHQAGGRSARRAGPGPDPASGRRGRARADPGRTGRGGDHRPPHLRRRLADPLCAGEPSAVPITLRAWLPV